LIISPEHPPLAMLHRAVVVSPFSRHGCCGVVRRPGLDERLVALSLATGLVLVPPSPRLLRCFLCLRCTSTGGLGSLACCGGLAFASKINTLFCAFWGSCSLGIGEALFLCLWVCLWLSWRPMGWRQTGCFCTASTTTGGLCLITAAKPPYGVDGAVFRGAVVCVLHGVPLKGAEMVMAVSRPGAPRD
jgi:hypothetical protein